MATQDEKATVEHINRTERSPSPSNADSDAIRPVRTVDSTNEEIVRNLQTTGEDVGLTFRTVMAALTMGSCYNAYLFTLLIPPAILSYINADLGPDPAFSWITVSWNLGGAIFVTIGGRLSDIFGRRWFFIGGNCLIIIGAIVSCTGKSIDQMIAGGALFGCGSGFLEMAFGAVQEVVPNKHRMTAIGLFDASSIIAQLMPLTSWAIIKYTHNWRICYYVMIGYQVLNLGLLWFFYDPPKFDTKHAGDGRSKLQLLAEFDWVGTFLFIAGCTLFICGVSWGGTLHPWKSGASIAPIVVGFFTLVGLGFWERYGPVKEALIPPRLFKQLRQFTLPIICMSISGIQYYSNATLWPRLSQLIYASDEISKGLYAEVLPLGTIIGGIIITQSRRIGHQRWQIFGAIALQTTCVGIMSTASIHNPVKSIILTVIISSCAGLVILQSLVLVCFGIVNQQDIGTAAGLAGTARLLFGGVGIAIFSNITNNKYRSVLAGHVRTAVAGLNVPTTSMPKLIAAAGAGTAAAYKAVPGINPTIRAAAVLANKEAYLEGAHLSYQVALAFGLCGCIAAFFLETIDERKFTNNTVAIQEGDRKAIAEKKRELA